MKFVPLFLLCWISSAAAQTFHIEPANPILAGEPLSIRIDGLPADKNVTLTAERTIEAPNRAGVQVLYRSQVVFSAPQGSLDLATAKPLSGSYTDADIRGLFWSMAPVAGGEVGGLKPLQVKLTAAADGRELASTTVEFIDSLPEVKVEQVKEFPGAVFATLPGSARRPAIILLGGSEGGGWVARTRSPAWASRGFAVLGLPYYSPGTGEREIPELPAAFADIPVDRLNAAFEWLKQRPEVDASRVALVGGSKGAEFALIAASRFKWITSVVASVPSDVVWEGWGPGVQPGTRSSFSLDGKPLPFVPYIGFAEEFDGYQHRTRREDAPLSGQRSRCQSGGGCEGAHRSRKIPRPAHGRRRARRPGVGLGDDGAEHRRTSRRRRTGNGRADLPRSRARALRHRLDADDAVQRRAEQERRHAASECRRSGARVPGDDRVPEENAARRGENAGEVG